MTEKYVQVPVSLIEQLRREYADVLPAGVSWSTVESINALLSTTPTAEPDRVFRCEDCGDEFEDDHYGDAQAHEDQYGHNVPSWTTPAAPPSIADMVPGTTFTEASNGWPRTAWTVGQRHDGMKYIKRQSDGWTVLDLDSIDPSTIRDVQPPKDAA